MMASEPAARPSLIETMRLERGAHFPLLEGHLRRLERSSAELAYPWPGKDAVMKSIRQATSELDPGASWRVRMLMAPDGRLSVETGPLPALPSPLKVVMQGPRMRGAHAWLLHKTTHRPWYAAATEWLSTHPEIFDILYWNEDGWMSEGSRSNLYIETQDGRWLTPPLNAGVLPGVQREALLCSGQVMEAAIHKDDFLRAKACRISNGLRGWQDVIVVSAL
ncbi:MAG TPA: aminotransferase class IV [Burkholderiaceae bacterium]|nr:aminotransferase class IV [Burkholderiaceae bacterium]